MNDSNNEFLKRAKQDFDDSVEHLDAATLSSLNRARQKALQAAGPNRRERNYWLPATGMAAAVLLVITVARMPDVVDEEIPTVATSDFEILLGDDSIDMLEELEFYSWLEVADLESDADVS